jgi:hypothetical protein
MVEALSGFVCLLGLLKHPAKIKKMMKSFRDFQFGNGFAKFTSEAGFFSFFSLVIVEYLLHGGFLASKRTGCFADNTLGSEVRYWRHRRNNLNEGGGRIIFLKHHSTAVTDLLLKFD